MVGIDRELDVSNAAGMPDGGRTHGRQVRPVGAGGLAASAWPGSPAGWVVVEPPRVDAARLELAVAAAGSARGAPRVDLEFKERVGAKGTLLVAVNRMTPRSSL